MFFTYHRDRFDAVYGDRAQVESAFGSIKQVLGETVASRNFDAQVNELFCKAIAHNIRMLIHAMLELGILSDFPAPAERPTTDRSAWLPDVLPQLLSVNSSPADTAVV